MLGWLIVITAQTPEELNRAEDRKAAILATWETSVNGIDWLEQFVNESKATELLSNGYPCRYVATARDVLPLIADGTPAHESPPIACIDDDVVIPANWSGNVTFHHDKITACPPDQALTIEAWDQS